MQHNKSSNRKELMCITLFTFSYLFIPSNFFPLDLLNKNKSLEKSLEARSNKVKTRTEEKVSLPGHAPTANTFPLDTWLVEGEGEA